MRDPRQPDFALLEKRSAILRALRDTLRDRAMLEVDTTMLHPAPAIEEHVDSFSCPMHHPQGGNEERFLHTSPEVAMKTLLSLGGGDMFQISHVFRNRQFSPLHQPEFTLVEWYRKNAGLENLFDDCQAMAATTINVIGSHHWRYRDASCDLQSKRWLRISVTDAFEKYCGIDLLATIDDPLFPDPRPFAHQAGLIGIRCDDKDHWDDIFFRIFTRLIEPELGRGRPTFLTDYPSPLALWARRNPDEPRLALRAELFLCGVEIANGFDELRDVEEFQHRVDVIRQRHEQRNHTPFIQDQQFLATMRRGLPACSGMALGLDRWIMLACGASRIQDVQWLPITMTPD